MIPTQGIVEKLYNQFRICYEMEFDYCITEISTQNPRSLKAHLKSGFKVVDTYRPTAEADSEAGETPYVAREGWDVVLYDWLKR